MKKLNKVAKEINSLLLENETIKEYLELKGEIENDLNLTSKMNRLNEYRKIICKDKEADSSEYFALLDSYNNDPRVKRYLSLKKEINEYFVEISDILSLK